MAEKVVLMVLIGAGNRGRGVFGAYALEMPHRARFVAVVEPDPKRRNAFADEHSIPEAMRFSSSDELFSQPVKIADAVVIATQETERLDIVRGAIRAEYSILVEKPLGCTPSDVMGVCDAAREYNGVFVVCHQMRHVAGYATLKKLVDSGRYGDLVAIHHSENLSYHHMAHSFVRGFFNNDAMSPMILAKSCHDMDILCYLTDKNPLRVSSFGSLNYFKEENAPAGAPAFCMDGCPAYRTCPYHVFKMYLSNDPDPAYLRQIGSPQSRKELFELLKTSRFGRCVFRCDNNVVDHQEVNVEFEDGITASFQMVGLNYHERRITKISMSNGEICFDTLDGVIKAYTFSPLQEELIKPMGMQGSHMGGDVEIMNNFVDAIQSGDSSMLLTSVDQALAGHLMAFSAEQSRVEGRVVKVACELQYACPARIRKGGGG